MQIKTTLDNITMTSKDILNLAKYIIFPVKNKDYYEPLVKSVNNLTYMPIVENNLYSKLEKNFHHYTTEYHRNYVLPVLGKMLNFDFNIDDFILHPNIVGESDLSYLIPKKQYNFKLISYTFKHTLNGGYDILVGPRNSHVDAYHGLYKFFHSCSRIINKDLHNGRKLFISGDSQMIPSISILACYFEEVWYFDNRTGRETNKLTGKIRMNKDKTKRFADAYKDVEFTDVLIALYKNPFEWYTKINLM